MSAKLRDLRARLRALLESHDEPDPVLDKLIDHMDERELLDMILMAGGGGGGEAEASALRLQALRDQLLLLLLSSEPHDAALLHFVSELSEEQLLDHIAMVERAQVACLAMLRKRGDAKCIH